MHAFHAAHFSEPQIITYAEQFLGPVEEGPAEEFYEEPDDGLGYYEDGVKRTLTDEQIAMFRHSEIQALLRARRLAREATDSEVAEEEIAVKESVATGLDVEDGQLGDDAASNKASSQAGKGKKRNGKKKKSWFKTNVKPDLRKRTWDKVDTGLSSLDYGESEGAEPAAKRSMQRKQISYDD